MLKSDVHQIIFERGKIFWQFYALFSSSHKSLQLCRDFHFTHNRLHGITELCRMGCFEEHTIFFGTYMFSQGLIAYGSVRVEQVMVFAKHLFDGSPYLVIVIGTARYILANGFVRVSIKV